MANQKNRRQFLKELAQTAATVTTGGLIVASLPALAQAPAPAPVTAPVPLPPDVWSKAYSHKTWALGMEITEAGMEDDLYGYYQALSRNLGRASAYTQEVELLDLFRKLGPTAS